jgi:hypothetical protein
MPGQAAWATFTATNAAACQGDKHGDAFWREELPLMVAWAFGR